MMVSPYCSLHLHRRETAYRVKKVAFGSGLATVAILNIKLASDALKFSPSPKPRVSTSLVIPLPSCGRKWWLARVFNIGHGPRTMHTVSFVYRVRTLGTYSHSAREPPTWKQSHVHSGDWQRPIQSSERLKEWRASSWMNQAFSVQILGRGILAGG